MPDFQPCCCLQAREALKGKTEERKEKTKRDGAVRAEEDLHRMSVLTNLCGFSPYQIVLSKQRTVHHFLTSFCFGIFQKLLQKAVFTTPLVKTHAASESQQVSCFHVSNICCEKHTTGISAGLVFLLLLFLKLQKSLFKSLEEILTFKRSPSKKKKVFQKMVELKARHAKGGLYCNSTAAPSAMCTHKQNLRAF